MFCILTKCKLTEKLYCFPKFCSSISNTRHVFIILAAASSDSRAAVECYDGDDSHLTSECSRWTTSYWWSCDSCTTWCTRIRCWGSSDQSQVDSTSCQLMRRVKYYDKSIINATVKQGITDYLVLRINKTLD